MDWWNRLPGRTKVIVGVGAVAGAYLILRWYKNRQAASSSNNPSVLSATTGAPGAVTPPTATVTLPNGANYSGPAQGLGSILGTLQTPPAPATTAANTPPVVSGVGPEVGSGYAPAGYVPNDQAADANLISTAANGQQYQYVSNPASVAGLGAAGIPFYYQPQQGQFVPYTPQAGSAPLFIPYPAPAGQAA